MAEIFEIRKAQRHKAKLRLGIAGPSGAGKTHSSLLIAKGIETKIGMIDTENKSGELEAGKPGIPEYDVITLEAPFTCDKYINAIKLFEKEGYGVIIIDSLTHAWSGEGGLLDLQGKIVDSGKANSYTAWRFITPKHNALVEAILQSKCHIIATMRSKMEYCITDNSGKKEVKKVGMEPIQRDGMEYEFTLFLDLDHNHTASASKDRTTLFDGQYFKPSDQTGRKLLDWLNLGIDAQTTSQTASEAPESEKVVSIVQNIAQTSETAIKEPEKASEQGNKVQAPITDTTCPETSPPAEEPSTEDETVARIIEAMKKAASEDSLKTICASFRPSYDKLSKANQSKIIKEKKDISALLKKKTLQQAAA
jgi:hypothetical protein